MIYIRKYIISFVTSIYVKYDHYNKIQKKKKTDSHIFYEEIRMRTNKDLFYKKEKSKQKQTKFYFKNAK